MKKILRYDLDPSIYGKYIMEHWGNGYRFPLTKVIDEMKKELDKQDYKLSVLGNDSHPEVPSSFLVEKEVEEENKFDDNLQMIIEKHLGFYPATENLVNAITGNGPILEQILLPYKLVESYTSKN